MVQEKNVVQEKNNGSRERLWFRRLGFYFFLVRVGVNSLYTHMRNCQHL